LSGKDYLLLYYCVELQSYIVTVLVIVLLCRITKLYCYSYQHVLITTATKVKFLAVDFCLIILIIIY